MRLCVTDSAPVAALNPSTIHMDRSQVRRVASSLIAPTRENVVNLMDALRRSVAAERPAKPALRRGTAKPATGRRGGRQWALGKVRYPFFRGLHQDL
jgi:hypothetical protein